jgi:hypothetical protein
MTVWKSNPYLLSRSESHSSFYCQISEREIKGPVFTVCCLLFTVYCLLFAVYYLLFTVYCLLFTVYSLLFTVYFALECSDSYILTGTTSLNWNL